MNSFSQKSFSFIGETRDKNCELDTVSDTKKQIFEDLTLSSEKYEEIMRKAIEKFKNKTKD